MAAAAVLIASPVAAQTYNGLFVAATANIFGAGSASNTTPNPGGGSGGTPAIGYALDNSGLAREMTFSNVTGTVSISTGVTTTPDGLAPGTGAAPFGLATNIAAYQGISGIALSKGSGFLVGVFLGNAAPSASAPPSLAFTNQGTSGYQSTGFATLAPLLQQTFFVGDGLTGLNTGTTQRFEVPNGATRLFLGFADGSGYAGLPGQYQDNSGALSVSFTVMATTVPEPAGTFLWAAGLALLACSRSRRFHAQAGRAPAV